MSGDVEVTSEPGKGSVFSIVLPLVEAKTQANKALQSDLVAPVHEHTDRISNADQSETQTTDIQHQSHPDFSDYHLLVAEDNLVNQMLLEAILESLGVRFVIVADGQAALDSMATQRFDLVLMDCQMPVVDGLSATAIARARGDKMPIVALTANAMKGDRERCIAAGMDDYLTKPFNTTDIVSLIETWGPSSQLQLKAA